MDRQTLNATWAAMIDRCPQLEVAAASIAMPLIVNGQTKEDERALVMKHAFRVLEKSLLIDIDAALSCRASSFDIPCWCRRGSRTVEHYIDSCVLSCFTLQVFRTFTNSPEASAICLSTQANNAGLNLVAANHLFLIDLCTNVKEELQLVNRVHRIGQKRDVTVHRFILKGSIEERAGKLLAFQPVIREVKSLSALTLCLRAIYVLQPNSKPLLKPRNQQRRNEYHG